MDKDKCKGCNNSKGCVTCVDGSEWAHYHYEEPVSEDLEQEIIKYIGFPQEVDEDISTTMIRKAARHFANWQKEYMEKEYSDLNKGLVSAKGVAVYMAYETGRKEVIAKACKYLQEHREEVETEDNGISGWISDEFIEKFKKAMKDE